MSTDFVLDAYAAKTCTYALHLNAVEDPRLRVPPDDALARRFAIGNEFEEAVGIWLLAHARAETLAAFPRDCEREIDERQWSIDRDRRCELTSSAIAQGIPVIWNPRLAPDPIRHRSGEPDLLFHIENSARGEGYVPIDVKAHHALVSDARANWGVALDSLFETGGAVLPIVGSELSAHSEDLLQLAHYWRMLEAGGLAPSGPPFGAIIGSSNHPDNLASISWFDLSEVIADYEEAFTLALEVVERARLIASGSSLDPLGMAWYTRACRDCGWRAVCGPRMLERRDVSLVSPNKRIWDDLDAMGISTIDELARLDGTTPRPDGRSVASSAPWRDAIRRAQLALAGDPVPLALFPEIAGEVTPRPRLWRRTEPAGEEWALPSGDVELDVDMECTYDHVYLWGTLLTYRDSNDEIAAPASGYRGFGDTYPSPVSEFEHEIFAKFWHFLESLVQHCIERGVQFRAYCYSSAENRWMRQCADRIDALHALSGPKSYRERVEVFITSPAWIDLHAEMKARVDSLSGIGLKNVAKVLGFSWRAKDAGGEASMVWYEQAIGAGSAEEREKWQRQVLDYNEDDVRATRFLRQWFADHSPNDLPSYPRFHPEQADL